MTRADRRATIQSRAHALAGAQTQPQSLRAEAPEGEHGTSAELWLYGVVGGWWWGFDAESVADSLRGLDVDEIQVRLHSPGGDAIDGIAIGNLLRNHKARITMVVDGLAASAASIIALAGDEIVMSPGSQMMIHDPWMLTVGNAAELRSDADFLDAQADNYAGIYALRASGSAEDWRAVMLADDGRGTWYAAQGAVDAGLADRVGTVTSSTPPPAEPSLEDLDDDFAARAAWDLEVLVHPAARAAWRPEAAPKPPSASAVGSTPTEGGTAMAFTPEQLTTMRSSLELPETADEAAIMAAVEAVVAENVEERTPPAAAVPDGMVLVEKDVLESMRSQASQGAAARQQQLNEQRDRTITQAVADGKITPARKEHWVSAWTADPEGTETTLAALAPGLVPVEERGHDQESTVAATAYDELYGSQQKGA